MALSSSDYLQQLQALLPPGPAWSSDDTSFITHLFNGLAQELARVDGRVLQLVEEADPRTVAELFSDWERVAGLPDACAVAFGGDQTVAQRRSALVGRLTTLGGQSPAYYIALLATLGFGAPVMLTRSTSASYYDSTGVLRYAAPNTARFTYDPANLGLAPALLIEDAATNLLMHSEQFDNAPWVKMSCSVVSNLVMSPDGNITGDFCKEDTSFGVHGLAQNASTAYINGATYTISLYAKAATQSKFLWSFGTTCFAGYPQGVFDLSAGTVVNNGALAVNITPVGNGWFRCSVTAICSKSGIDPSIMQMFTASNAYVGDGVSGMYFWGAQLEIGSTATSHIPTTTTAASRGADTNLVYLAPSVPLQGDYAITISEFAEHSVGDDVDHPIYNTAWNFAWQVNAPLNTVAALTVDGTVDEPLAVWGNSLLECVIKRLAPAQSTVLFSYT